MQGAKTNEKNCPLLLDDTIMSRTKELKTDFKAPLLVAQGPQETGSVQTRQSKSTKESAIKSLNGLSASDKSAISTLFSSLLLHRK
jgi:hypothetical protein